ncbi:hypothetical protein HPB47_018626 [Ixodes persulcatus]|uniref:Uncharacterized protein n=1 Tax=Ixodes persulcatus TaxID=34615 RepID=A0AC60QK96_IXOPE|nr:hypothetical protein HPB47_018626 [Ixodes persulcatus]
MASETEVATSMGDNMASTLSIGSFGGRTYIEVHGEDITPEEAEGWLACGKRIKQIMAGKENAKHHRGQHPGPDERRATLYSKVKALNIGGRTYEVSAYRTAPDGTVKAVIRGIALDDTPEEIAENIVNPYNPLAVEAHRIGNTTTVIVLFAGQKVPNYVKYGSILVRCGHYCKHFDVCKQCGKVSHRRDVCPNPNTRVCFGCGIANPSEGHERECKPKCRLCGGQHPMGERECKKGKPFTTPCNAELERSS